MLYVSIIQLIWNELSVFLPFFSHTSKHTSELVQDYGASPNAGLRCLNVSNDSIYFLAQMTLDISERHCVGPVLVFYYPSQQAPTHCWSIRHFYPQVTEWLRNAEQI